MGLLNRPAVRYKWRDVDKDGNWSKPLHWVNFVLAIRKQSKMIAPGPYRINEQFTDWKGSVELTRREALKRFFSHLKGHIGAAWIMKASKGSIAARTVQINLPIPIQNTTGNDRIDKIYTVVFSKWDHLENWGICVCKRISGTYSWSQHSYCNAIDINGTSHQMYEISRFLVDNADELNVYTVIYNRQAWSRRTPYWHYYNGTNPHTDHVHVDCSPQGTGYPPTC